MSAPTISTLGSAWRFAIFAAVTVLATALLALTIANVDTQSTQPYSAVFTDAANVISGDEVRYAGVRVGTVSGVSLYHGTQAKVSFKLDDNVDLTSTTQLAIRYRNLIGQRYLAVVDGPTGGTPESSGYVVPLSRTSP